MMHGRNNGKKMLSLRIVRQAFEIIHLLTGEVREAQTVAEKWNNSCKIGRVGQ